MSDLDLGAKWGDDLDENLQPVSYTHLDVYKRQTVNNGNKAVSLFVSFLGDSQNLPLDMVTPQHAKDLSLIHIFLVFWTGGWHAC